MQAFLALGHPLGQPHRLGYSSAETAWSKKAVCRMLLSAIASSTEIMFLSHQCESMKPALLMQGIQRSTQLPEQPTLRPSDSCQSLNGGSPNGTLADGSMQCMKGGKHRASTVSSSTHGASSEAESLNSLQAVLNGR